MHPAWGVDSEKKNLALLFVCDSYYFCRIVKIEFYEEDICGNFTFGFGFERFVL